MKIIQRDGISQDTSQALIIAFEAEDYPDFLKNLRARGIDPLSYINSLDEVSSYPICKV